MRNVKVKKWHFSYYLFQIGSRRSLSVFAISLIVFITSAYYGELRAESNEDSLKEQQRLIEDILTGYKNIVHDLLEKKAREMAESITILGCTFDKTDSGTPIPNVFVTLFYASASVDSHSITSGRDGIFIDTLPVGVNNAVIYRAEKPHFRTLIGSLTITNKLVYLPLLMEKEPETKKIVIEILRSPATASPSVRWQPLPNRAIKITWKTSWKKVEQTYPPTDKSGSVEVEIPEKEGLTVSYEIWHGERTERKGTINYGEISKDGVLKILITPK
jgi:hypothetical protein